MKEEGKDGEGARAPTRLRLPTTLPRCYTGPIPVNIVRPVPRPPIASSRSQPEGAPANESLTTTGRPARPALSGVLRPISPDPPDTVTIIATTRSRIEARQAAEERLRAQRAPSPLIQPQPTTTTTTEQGPARPLPPQPSTSASSDSVFDFVVEVSPNIIH